MAKIKVLVWSGTGNTMQMANAVAQGINGAGGEAELLAFSQIDPATLAQEDKFILGCPAMGAEVLEESEVEPFMTELDGLIKGKKVGLFGSYGWGDGEWMRSWEARIKADGAEIIGGSGVMANNAPDADASASCEELGKAAVGA